MNAKDLLNLDMASAAQLLLQFWRWWTDELLAMLPPEWRERLTRRSHIVAQVRGNNIVYTNEETGSVLASKPRGAIKFLIPQERVLTRQIDLPLLPISDVKRMVALEIDRLSPFQPEQVYFDADIIARDPESGRQQVAVGILPRTTAEQVLGFMHEHDLAPAAIGITHNGVAAPDFDFLAAMRDAQGGDAAQRRSLYWWVAAAVLLVVNIGFLAYRDSSNLDALRQAVEAQQLPVTAALRTRDKVNREAAQRTLLLQTKSRTSPLPVLDAVTKAMPMDAWVSRFEWNGRTVHIRGQRKSSNDILARLEASPVLKNARSLSGDTRAGDGVTPQPFDMQADRQFGGSR
ncbi:MAG TPA: PilN domain-containing protein [Rhizomicrobium sp.]|nr:PilN domain-containing protein [Rhizomicrobium sp.]